MVEFNQGIRVVDQISQYSSALEYWQPIMRESFAHGAGQANGDLTTQQLIDGLTRAVHDGLWGLHLDHSETDQLSVQANEFIETRVDIPDNTTNYERFNYTGDDVTDGLATLDSLPRRPSAAVAAGAVPVAWTVAPNGTR